MATSFYDTMRFHRLERLRGDLTEHLRYAIQEDLVDNHKLSYPFGYNSRGIEAAIVYIVARDWLQEPEECDVQLEKLDNRKYRSGAPYMTADLVVPVIRNYFTQVFKGLNEEIETTEIFPFGYVARDPHADTTRMTPEQLERYLNSPDNLMTYAEVVKYGLEKGHKYMILYDLYLDRIDENEVLGSLPTGSFSAFNNPGLITPDQAERIYCRVFCMSPQIGVTRFLDAEFQEILLENFSKPHFNEGISTHRWVKRWWNTVIREPVDTRR